MREAAQFMSGYLNDELILPQVIPVFEDCHILLLHGCPEGQPARLQGRLEERHSPPEDATYLDLQQQRERTGVILLYMQLTIITI